MRSRICMRHLMWRARVYSYSRLNNTSEESGNNSAGPTAEACSRSPAGQQNVCPLVLSKPDRGGAAAQTKAVKGLENSKC